MQPERRRAGIERKSDAGRSEEEEERNGGILSK